MKKVNQSLWVLLPLSHPKCLAECLKVANIRHTVLNAKFHEREAEIVAQAGQKGAVTIATNMAGRWYGY